MFSWLTLKYSVLEEILILLFKLKQGLPDGIKGTIEECTYVESKSPFSTNQDAFCYIEEGCFVLLEKQGTGAGCLGVCGCTDLVFTF